MILEMELINKITKKEGFKISNVTPNFSIFLIASKFQKENKTISYRLHGKNETTTVSPEEFVKLIKEEIKNKTVQD